MFYVSTSTSIHVILLESYTQARYHELIQECQKFADIPSSNIAHWPNTFVQQPLNASLTFYRVERVIKFVLVVQHNVSQFFSS